MKNWKAATAIALCSVSLVGLGFSTWIYGNGNSSEISVSVGADKVDFHAVNLEDIGFNIVPNSFKDYLPYVTIVDGNSSESYVSLDVGFFSVEATIDPSQDIEFAGENYLTITFGYSGYASPSQNVVSSLNLCPANFEDYVFEADISPTVQQSRNSYQTRFYFPIKSESQMSLYDLAELDTTYPRPEDNDVPILFRFSVENPDATTLASSGAKISIVFSLSETIE